MVNAVPSVPTRSRSIATPTAVSAAATPTAMAGLTPSTVAMSERSGIGHGPPGRSRSGATSDAPFSPEPRLPC
jgi:hypothetical protein